MLFEGFTKCIQQRFVCGCGGQTLCINSLLLANRTTILYCFQQFIHDKVYIVEILFSKLEILH